MLVLRYKNKGIFMFYKIAIVFLFFLHTSIADEIGFEYKGVNVKTIGTDGKIKNILVKRHMHKECKAIILNNEMFWTGNYAHKSVPKACKSTYVHAKGKLLPISLGEDIETYAELEVLASLKDIQRNNDTVLIDSRKESWFKYRTIPGAINMPYYYFKEHEDYEFHFEYALKYLGVKILENKPYDFSKVKMLIIFCNGPWCTQSPIMIAVLIDIGYPAEKIKWYRGGMESWLSAGMTSTRDTK